MFFCARYESQFQDTYSKTGTGFEMGLNHSSLNCVSWTSWSANDLDEDPSVNGGNIVTDSSNLIGWSRFHLEARSELTIWAYIVAQVGTTRQSGWKKLTKLKYEHF